MVEDGTGTMGVGDGAVATEITTVVSTEQGRELRVGLVEREDDKQRGSNHSLALFMFCV